MATSAPPIPRVELAYAPTPLLKLERLSAELGVELWVKRDDLTGLLETGNKIRKLEFLVGEALAQKADTLITCGTLQSNCCRCVAGLAGEIVSIPIAWEGARVRAYVTEVIERARGRFGLAVRPPAEVRLLDGYQGVGRAAVRKDELDTMLKLARLEGIILDPVYTAKAFTGLLDTLRRAPRALGPRVCFVHTGGVLSVFPYRAALSRLVDGDGLVES